jgi:integrase/recombinase XerD
MKILNDNLTEECFRKAKITGELCPSSIAKYRDSLKKFFSIVGEKKFEDLQIADFEDFIIKMQDGGAGNSRIANIISAVKGIMRKLQKSGLINKNLDLEKIIKPKIIKKEVNYLVEAEIEKFLGSILGDIDRGVAIRKIRMMALVVLLLESGARIGEALSIKIIDIDWDNMAIPIIGKGGKQRSLMFKGKTRYWLEKYLAIRKDESEFLFVTLDGKSRWSQTDVGRSFRRYRNLSGIKKKFTLHTLRHTAATQLAIKSVPFNIIQRILGHTNLETTVKYYVGAAEKKEIEKIMRDEYYNFIPEEYLITRASGATHFPAKLSWQGS